jgi:hypothetical protein
VTPRLPLAFLGPAIAATVAVVAGSCSSDAGRIEAGTTDVGTADAGTTEVGSMEVGMTDVGTTDVGTTDVGPTDVGLTDAETSDALTDDVICAQICQLGTQAGCGADAGCVAMCQQDLAMPDCKPEKRAAQLCVIGIGPDAITCMNGRPFVKQTVCVQERQAQTACLLAARSDAARD